MYVIYFFCCLRQDYLPYVLSFSAYLSFEVRTGKMYISPFNLLILQFPTPPRQTKVNKELNILPTVKICTRTYKTTWQSISTVDTNESYKYRFCYSGHLQITLHLVSRLWTKIFYKTDKYKSLDKLTHQSWSFFWVSG